MSASPTDRPPNNANSPMMMAAPTLENAWMPLRRAKRCWPERSPSAVWNATIRKMPKKATRAMAITSSLCARNAKGASNWATQMPITARTAVYSNDVVKISGERSGLRLWKKATESRSPTEQTHAMTSTHVMIAVYSPLPCGPSWRAVIQPTTNEPMISVAAAPITSKTK